MPAESEKQRRLAMLALHNPSKVHRKNRSILRMSKRQLEHFGKRK